MPQGGGALTVAVVFVAADVQPLTVRVTEYVPPAAVVTFAMDPSRAARVGHLPVGHAVVRSCDDQIRLGQHCRREARGHVHDLTVTPPGSQRRAQLRRHDRHTRARSAQQRDLACGHFAAADHDAALAPNVQKHRQIVHGRAPSSPFRLALTCGASAPALFRVRRQKRVSAP